MSSTDQIVTLFESLSFAEKLSLNERLATAMRKEGGGAAGKKRGPKAKAKGGDKPKRKAALGTLAWMAYVKHIKATKPDAMEGLTKEAEKLTTIKGIRAEDPEGYNAFVAAWKEEHKDDASEDASEAASEAEAEGEAEDDGASVASAPAPAPKALSPLEKIAAIKVAKAAAAAAAPKAVAAAPKAAPAPAPKATPAKAKAAAAAPGAPKKAVKAAVKKEEPAAMPSLEIAGVEYWHDPSSNFLWLKTGDNTLDGMGEEVGYFQPDNEEEPIRAAAFGDE
jgi:hypothetical protein